MSQHHEKRLLVTKADGRQERWSRRKLERSIERSGAPRRVARALAERVMVSAYPGMTTRAIERMVMQLLRREGDVGTTANYSLKHAMRKLGPAGYDFEKYVAAILRAYDFATHLPDLIPGRCVLHEVDVVATRDGRTAMIEAKYRNAPGLHVRLKDIMATWARYGDLRAARGEGKHAYDFTECWVVTNTRMTGDGIAFGECYGMHLLGWRYPADRGLETMIEDRHLYPMTVLRTVTPPVQHALAQAGVMLCHDLLGTTAKELARRTGLPYDSIERIQREGAKLLTC